MDNFLSAYTFFDVLSFCISWLINCSLIIFVTYILYKIYCHRRVHKPVFVEEEKLPKLRRDFTVDELKDYNGTSSAPYGRILIAINGKVFDVTKGKVHYGPGGPYSKFGGRDASRGLATFNMVDVRDGYDDLSDLDTHEIESMKEWEMQFTEKYDYVGKLLKPGEEPTVYSDDESEKVQKNSIASSSSFSPEEKPKDE